MWSIRIAVSVAALVAATASANAQTARTDPHAEPLPLQEINQRPFVEPSPVVVEKPAQQTSAKPKKAVAATRSRSAPPGNAARPQAATTQSMGGPRDSAAATQGIAPPAAYADAPSPARTFPLASSPALDLPADARKEPAHLAPASSVAPPERVTVATVPTPSPQRGVPTMVATPEPLAASRLWASGSWLLLGALCGGVAVGAAIVWLMVGLRTGRARPRRQDEADQPVRYPPVSAYNNPHDNPRLSARDSEEGSPLNGYDLASASDNQGDGRGPADAKRRPYSRGWENAARPWRTSANGDSWSRSTESEKPDPRRGQNRTPVSDDRWSDSREGEETDPRWGASAHDAVSDALREIEEADQPNGSNGASADDADARLRSAMPPEPSPLDQRATTLPGAADAPQLKAGRIPFESLEEEITSLLGRAVGKKSRRKEADEPSGRGDAASTYGVVGDARTRSATLAEASPLYELGTTPFGEAETRQPYDSLEQKLASLLGRSTGKNAQMMELDEPRDRKAATALDAVRFALRGMQETDESGGYNASVYDGIRDALTDGEEANETHNYDAASADDAVDDAFGDPEEVDEPSDRKATSAYDAVRDALAQRQQTDQPGDHNAPSAYDAVGDALSESEEVEELSGHNAAGALRDALREWAEADQPRRRKWL
jgi:hypothetical protein